MSLVARGQRPDDIREHGVVLEDYSTGQRSVMYVPTVNAPALGDAYDLVLVYDVQDSGAVGSACPRAMISS